MAGVKLIREGRLEPEKVKATLRGKPAKATNVKLGPGWADVMPVEPRGVRGNSDAKPAMKQEAPNFSEGRSHLALLNKSGTKKTSSACRAICSFFSETRC